MSIVGQNIKRLREALGESQNAFGERFKLTRGKIASYEATKNDSQPSFETILNIVDNFNIDLRSFISDPNFDIKATVEASGKSVGQNQNRLRSLRSEFHQSLLPPVVKNSNSQPQTLNQEAHMIRLQNRIDALLDMASELSLQIKQMRSDSA